MKSLLLAVTLCLLLATGVPAAVENDQPDPKSFVPVDVYPELIKACTPEYPDSAKAAGLEGKVYVKALVDRTGEVASVVLLKTSGHRVLDQAAIKAVPDCKFKPAVADDKPVAVWVTFPIEFKLDDHD